MKEWPIDRILGPHIYLLQDVVNLAGALFSLLPFSDSFTFPSPVPFPPSCFPLRYTLSSCFSCNRPHLKDIVQETMGRTRGKEKGGRRVCRAARSHGTQRLRSYVLNTITPVFYLCVGLDPIYCWKWVLSIYSRTIIYIYMFIHTPIYTLYTYLSILITSLCFCFPQSATREQWQQQEQPPEPQLGTWDKQPWKFTRPKHILYGKIHLAAFHSGHSFAVEYIVSPIWWRNEAADRWLIWGRVEEHWHSNWGLCRGPNVHLPELPYPGLGREGHAADHLWHFWRIQCHGIPWHSTQIHENQRKDDNGKIRCLKYVDWCAGTHDMMRLRTRSSIGGSAPVGPNQQLTSGSTTSLLQTGSCLVCLVQNTETISFDWRLRVHCHHMDLLRGSGRLRSKICNHQSFCHFCQDPSISAGLQYVLTLLCIFCNVWPTRSTPHARSNTENLALWPLIAAALKTCGCHDSTWSDIQVEKMVSSL